MLLQIRTAFGCPVRLAALEKEEEEERRYLSIGSDEAT